MPRWLTFTLLTMLLWGGWGVLSKPLSSALSPWQLQTFSVLGLLPVLALLGRSPGMRVGANRRRGFALGFGSGVLGSVGNVAYYQALAAGGKAAAVTPITALYPLVTIGLALVFLRERLNRVQAAGVVASLAALYLFNVGSDTGWLTPWLGVALLPIAFWGASALLQKMATGSASTEWVTVAFLLGEFPVALLTPLFQPLDLALPGMTWLMVVVLGLFFGLGNLTLIVAYASDGRAAVVTPLASLYAVVTIPLAVLFLHEHVAAREWAGIALALAAVVALGWETPTSPPPGTTAAAPGPGQPAGASRAPAG
jgi:transporter family protein